jgi:uncharacterized protein (TIGR02996 family)
MSRRAADRSSGARRAFLQAIQEAPDDDVPRLIFSDWLQEHGEEARAEFIRVQCQLSRLPETAPERPALQQRESALLREHLAEWLGPWKNVTSQTEFHRGLLTTMRISKRGGYLGLLSQSVSPYLDTLDTLVFRQTNLADAILPVLAENPPPFLRRVECDDSPRANAVVNALARFPAESALAELIFRGCRIGPMAFKALLAASWVGRLALLEMGPAGGPGWGYSRPQLGAAELRALAPCASLPNLRELRLEGQGLGDAAAGVLATWPSSGVLTTLSLRYNPIGDAGAAALAGAGALSGLTTLRLDQSYAPNAQNPLTAVGVLALLRAAHLSRLRTLTLSRNAIGGDGLEAIANCPGLERCTTLDLSYCGVGEDGVVALARSRYARNLTSLNLHANNACNAGAIALARSPHLRCLEALDLGQNGIDEEGVVALATSRSLSALRHLNLSMNALGEDTVAALREQCRQRGVRLTWP